MKAELIRKNIEKYVPKTLFKGKSENHELYHVHAELEQLEKYATTYRELMTPYKPIRKLLGLGIDCNGDCKCGTQVWDDEIHCHVCGQKLDWRSEGE